MSLVEWQRALRRQAASNEYFGIAAPASQGDPFIVSSPQSKRVYRVNYFGEGSSLNRCECMDFKTSRLGTCKHIEAISLASGGKYARRSYPAPAHTFVFLDYVDGRKVKICQGIYAPEEMKALASTLFDSSGVLKDAACDPSSFIRKATEIEESFVWETDALNLVIETRDRIRREKIIADKYADSSFAGLIKTALHPYQADGVRFAFAGGRTINADEMGLGKTVQAIATAELLKRECKIESVIIICPTSLKYQWLSEIKRFTDSTVLVVEGDVIKRGQQLSDSKFFYKICSFHAMSNSIKAGYIPQADMVIYDELQRLKNRETQMGKQLRKLPSRYVLALSGTPLENKLDELYSVIQLVDQFVLGPYYRFTAESTLTDDIGKVVGYKNLHAIAERLKSTMIRRRKVDVKLQMPARTDTILFVPMTKEQRAIHDEYKFQVGILIDKWHRHKFLSEADRNRLLLFLSMMRMVCDSTFILDQKTRHDTKIDEIKAIVANMLAESDGKVVIFSQWERMLRILARELEQDEIDFCFLHGGVPSPKRKDLIDRFRDDAACRIFLSTDAGATGLNLQSASLLINIDLPWNPAVLEQRVARIYRLGQRNPVQIINMVARATIEERMLSTLKFKSSLAAGILDGGEDAVFNGDGKFKQIIEVVDEVVSDSADSDSENTVDVGNTESAGNPDKEKPADNAHPEPRPGRAEEMEEHKLQIPSTNATEIKSHNRHLGVDQMDAPSAPAAGIPDSTPKVPATGSAAAGKTQAEVRDIVTDGLTALCRIADVLRQPQGAKTLAEAIVKEDPDTGQASINIPIASKSTVVNLLSAITALLNR